MSNANTPKKTSWSLRPLFIPLIAFFVFSLGFFPAVILAKLVLTFISFAELWHFLLLPFLFYVGLAVTVVSQLLISGSIVSLFHIRYEPGTYTYSYREKNSFRWILVCVLYTPCRKILEIFPLGRTKNEYYKLLGMKIGANSLVGGTIKDPCITEFGDNVTMGEYAVIYGHIHNYEEGAITIRRVKVGNNCVIGAGALIMPGATIHDDVIVAAGAVVTQNQALEKGKIYAGVPAKPIGEKLLYEAAVSEK